MYILVFSVTEDNLCCVPRLDELCNDLYIFLAGWLGYMSSRTLPGRRRRESITDGATGEGNCCDPNRKRSKALPNSKALESYKELWVIFKSDFFKVSLNASVYRHRLRD
jgi:hypothetical protein